MRDARRPPGPTGEARKPRVVVADFLEDELDPERRVLEEIASVEALRCANEEELVERAGDAQAVMLWHVVRLTARGLANLPNCRIVVRMGVGLDNIDIDAATRQGIFVAHVPDYGTEEVADSTMAMALSLARGVNALNDRCRRNGTPWSYTAAAPVHRLRGRTFGLLGMSRIGTAVALRAKAFGFDVIFHDPYLPHGVEKALGVRRADTLDDLLSASHVLSLHCLLTDETRHVIDAAALARLPAGAILINTSRGALIDQAGVLDALASGRLGGAGLDVLEREPPDDDDLLIRAWRDPSHPAHAGLIVNPHAAFYSEEGIDELRTKAAIACRQALQGLPAANTVNAAASQFTKAQTITARPGRA